MERTKSHFSFLNHVEQLTSYLYFCEILEYVCGACVIGYCLITVYDPVNEARGLILVIIMSNYPIKVTAGKIVDISLITFTDVCIYKRKIKFPNYPLHTLF